jgi:signal transduction histidine kinase
MNLMTASPSRPDRVPGNPAAQAVWRGAWQTLLRRMSALGPHAPRRAAADATPDPVLLVDARGRIEHANAAATVCFGGPLARREVADVLHGMVRLSDRAALWPRGDAPPHGFECESQDTQHRRLAVRVTVRAGIFGGLSGWTIAVRDCTAEHLLREQLDAALRLLNHDLRAPHSTILGVLELWRLRQGTMSEADLLSQVENSATAALSMADDFVRHVRAQQADLRREPLDLNEVAADAVDELWERARARRIAIRRPQGPPVPVPVCVVGDAPLLQRAIGNLLRHALDRSPGGASIRCTVVRSGTGVAVEVTDPGATPDPGTPSGAADPDTGQANDGVPVLPAEDDYVLGFVSLVARRHGGVLRQRRAATQGLTMSLVLPGGHADGAADSEPAATESDSSSDSSRYPTP